MLHTVGISDMKITRDPRDVLVTYSLGSCIGVAMYDPEACIGCMIHCMLPTAKIDTNRAAVNPYMFTDVGVPEMLQQMLNMGAQKRRIIAKVAGAARLLDDENTFRIGERNQVVLRKILWKNNILIAAEDTGSNIARTLYLYMDTGRVMIKSGGREYELK